MAESVTPQPPHEIRVVMFRGSATYIISAGTQRTERIVPPAGGEYAFERTTWQHCVEVYISPTGRRVRVWRDGEELRDEA